MLLSVPVSGSDIVAVALAQAWVEFDYKYHAAVDDRGEE
jgi:hypothetical protein